MPRLVHITAGNILERLRRNGIAATRWSPDPMRHPEHDRVVWAFPVLPSYTLTHGWARELKRWGRTSLVAVTFRIADGEPVYARHYSGEPRFVCAGDAVGMIAAQSDPRGYEIMVPRAISAREIVKIAALPKAIGWRYWPQAKNAPLRLCDCPMCVPRGEVKARRYRERVKAAMARRDGGTPDY